MIGRVARSQAPVHITGESGTGKELVARLIHESGPRKDAPFVPVSCGAIPSELMESELFGHRRGSFTGAVADKLGLVQAAEGGTLFLDEVADLPFVMQVKLLRLIQEKTARPVGDQREQPVDVRILSATHRDLGELVAAGRFREDLYYRINVIEMRVPALRERLSDIPELAAAVTQRFAARLGMAPPAISDEAMELLATHDLPGQRPRARERHRARADALRRRRDPARRHRAARPADVRGFACRHTGPARCRRRSRTSSGPRSARRSRRPATTRPPRPARSASASGRCATASRSSASSDAARHFVTLRVASSVARPRRSSDNSAKNMLSPSLTTAGRLGMILAVPRMHRRMSAALVSQRSLRTMKTFQKGFTLIELMIVVAIIGILAAIAIPAYQDYTIRAQVSEGLTLASDIKAGVAEYAAQTGDWPVDLAEAGLGSAAAAADKSGRYVDSRSTSQNGTIMITYGRDANSKIQGCASWRSSRWSTTNGDVVWRCGKSNHAAEHLRQSAALLVAATTRLTARRRR